MVDELNTPADGAPPEKRRGNLAIRSLILTVAVAATVAATVLAMRPTYRGARAGHADEDYV
jgi:hypothetical protein